LAQTLDNWEVVVVDDHSDQADLEALIHTLSDSRVRYISQGAGRTGEAAGRETAIAEARSNILITLDSDDLNHPQRAARCHELLKVPTPRMLYTRVHLFSNTNPSGRPKPVFQPFNAKLLEMVNFITNPGTAFNRAAYTTAGGHYNTSLKLATDYDQFLRMARAGVSMIGLDEMHVSYRKHAGAVTSGAGEALHRAVMQIRQQNNVTPFPIEAIRPHSLPELCHNILDNPEQRALWTDDRWNA
jgi:glycosyltransferase involved in cell wall biosynthesis